MTKPLTDYSQKTSAALVVKRIFGLLIMPAAVMAALATVLPNPDGALAFAMLCMVGANFLLKQ